MSDLVEIFVTETAEEVTLNVTPNLIEVNVIKGIGDINLTTTGNSGASTYNTTTKTLNVPTYTLAGLGGQPLLTNPITGTGTTNRLPKFTGASTLGNSLIFDNGTNVGIGTTSPAARLDLGNSADAVKLLVFNSGNIKYGFGIQPDTLRYFVPSGGSNAIHSFGFISTIDGTTYTEALRIAANGNVGIGTTSPEQKLHVVGNGLVEGVILYRNGPTNILNIGGDQNMYGGTNSDGGVFVYGANKLHLSTNSARRLTVDGAGNVGIGTTSPTSRLHVVGLPTSSAGLTAGAIWIDGTTLRIVI